MDNIVDARGLSCPQPVIMTLDKMKRVKEGDIAILVDTITAEENVSRSARKQGWTVVDRQDDEGAIKIIIRKEA